MGSLFIKSLTLGVWRSAQGHLTGFTQGEKTEPHRATPGETTWTNLDICGATFTSRCEAEEKGVIPT